MEKTLYYYCNKVINMAFSLKSFSEKELKYVAAGYCEKTKTAIQQIAETKKIIPHIAFFFIRIELDVEYWKPKYECYKARNKKIIELVDAIFIELNKREKYKAFAYENFGVLLSSGNDIALYSSGDVDLYADIAYKESIKEVMLSFGYEPVESVFDRRGIMTEFKSKKDGYAIRINFDWIPLRRLRFPIPINIDEIVEWNNLRKYGDTSISMPSKEALLYLCALRIAVHGYSRSPDVRMIFDMTNATLSKPNWDIIIEWARRDGYLTKLFATTLIAYKLNSITLPDWVVQMAISHDNAVNILKECYSEEDESLIYDPKGIKLLRIEALSDDRTLLGQVCSMLFPQKKWLTSFYAEPGDSIFKIYFNYYKHLV